MKIQETRIKPAVDVIMIKWITDDNPDLSYLETTADEHYGINGANWDHVCDVSKQEVINQYGSIYAACKAYAKQDEEQLNTYGLTWNMVGCVVKAQVSYAIDTGRRLEWFASGGLWGIESDSDPRDMREIESEQIDDLKNHLEHYNIDVSKFGELVNAARA